MILQFHNVSLDPEKRELRCSGEEVAVQPLALDLLLYLIRNRDRVVPKQELLEKLWPDAIVAEGSLTRAISLARTALKPGGAEAAIRTHARQGYRFVAPLAGEPVSAGAPGLHSRLALPASALESAHAACDRGAWDEAIALFKKADAESPLAASDLECWAVAARCAGKGSETSPPLERAVAARAMGGDPVGSARAATLMAIVHLERRELAVAQGWLARARRKLEGSAERPEHGHVAWVASKFASELGDHDEAYRLAEDSYQIGRRLGDVDLEALGLLQKGSALLAMGRSDEGAPMHDEAAAVVLSDAVTPLVGGTVYCGVLFGCRNGSDWQRASQWSTHFKAWCDRNGLGNFLGPCRDRKSVV